MQQHKGWMAVLRCDSELQKEAQLLVWSHIVPIVLLLLLVATCELR